MKTMIHFRVSAKPIIYDDKKPCHATSWKHACKDQRFDKDNEQACCTMNLANVTCKACLKTKEASAWWAIDTLMKAMLK